MDLGKIARRTFILGATAITGGVVLGYYYVRRPYSNPLHKEQAEGETVFNPYLKISDDNEITIIVPRAEMGQGVQTTLAALVAEELELDLERVRIEHGPAGWAYYNTAILEDGGPFPSFDESFFASTMRSASHPVSKLLGMQVTGGSSSTRDAFDKMRKAGCAARQMLVAAAAEQWALEPEVLQLGNGMVTGPGGEKSATYGELAAAAARQEVPEDLRLKHESEWRLLGKSLPRTDIPAKVTGQAEFGIDVNLPDMVYGTVVISPRFGAKPVSADTEAVLAMPGVLQVVPIDLPCGAGYGIIAENTWAAFKGAEALNVEWEEASYPKTSEALFMALSERLDSSADFSLRDDGDVELAFADAPRDEVVEAEYRVPWLAHACMEPMNATARWSGGVLDIWAPNQAPTVIQMTAAPLVGVAAEDVNVHTTLLGGGFGRRAEMDFALYAVEMAKHTKGRPIKVTWTREEDTRHDAYRPAAVAKMRARVRRRELPQALDIAVASPSILKSYLGRTFPSISPMGPDKLVTEGAHDQPYTIENYRVSGHVADLPIPVGFWRSVGNSYNGFFHEAFMDEIAQAADLDPLGMRLQLMRDYPAAVNVLQKVSQMAGWGRDFQEGTGLGLAHTLSFGAWTAQVVEVSDNEDGIRIEKVWCAVEIGTALDPEIVKAQMMSGIVFGLSSAMGQEITFADGEVEQSNFVDFDAMRMNQCPEIEIEILATHDKMGGAGEPGTPPSIPALANAIYAATGNRLRSMPFSDTVDFA